MFLTFFSFLFTFLVCFFVVIFFKFFFFFGGVLALVFKTLLPLLGVQTSVLSSCSGPSALAAAKAPGRGRPPSRRHVELRPRAASARGCRGAPGAPSRSEGAGFSPGDCGVAKGGEQQTAR